MQEVRTLVETGEVLVTVVRCRHERPGWSEIEPVGRLGMVLVRSGLFRREVDGDDGVVDACAGYLQRPGGEQRIAHPVGDDVCTFVSVPDDLLDVVLDAGGPPVAPVRVDPALDLAHRALVARSRTGATPDELAERAVVLAGSVVLPSEPGHSRRATMVADGVREVLAGDPRASLGALAGGAGLSTYHVSRVFRRTTGLTITAYRSRLRARRALERLVQGERDLATVAIETGYADQAHLTRELRRETGETPAVLRRIWDAQCSYLE